MKTTSLTTFRSDIRERVDIDSGDDRIGDALLDRLINKSKDALVRLVQVNGGGNWYWSEQDGVEIAADAGLINLRTGLNTSNTFHRLHKVEWLDGYSLAGSVASATGRMYPMRRSTVDNYYDELVEQKRAWDAGNLPRYRIVGETLQFNYANTNAVGVILHFSSIPADLSAGGDVLVHGPGWEEWIVLDVAARLLQRDRSDPSQMQAERSVTQASIEEDCAQFRDEWGLHQVRDADDHHLGDREIRDLVTRYF